MGIVHLHCFTYPGTNCIFIHTKYQDHSEKYKYPGRKMQPQNTVFLSNEVRCSTRSLRTISVDKGDPKGPKLRILLLSHCQFPTLQRSKTSDGSLLPVTSGFRLKTIGRLQVGLFICFNHQLVHDQEVGLRDTLKRLQAEPHR